MNAKIGNEKTKRHKNVAAFLKNTYRAADCCDVDDCDHAIAAIRQFAAAYKMDYTPAMQKRLAALMAKRNAFIAKASAKAQSEKPLADKVAYCCGCSARTVRAVWGGDRSDETALGEKITIATDMLLTRGNALLQEVKRVVTF